AWRWTLDFLRRQYDEWRVEPTPARLAEVLSEYDTLAGMLGTRLAELHAALALPSEDPAFAPEAADAVARRGWVEAVRAGYDGALATLQATPIEDWLLADRARRLVELRDPVHERLGWLAEAGRSVLLTRIHGDFHLGQVLVAQGDVYLIDFEGEPARPLAERRAKCTPLRDVAGLLRSFDYAAALFGRGEDGVAPVDDGELAPFLDGFRERATRVFTDAYLVVAAEAPRRWADPSAIAALVELFSLDKAAYEVRYEAAHRPGWIGVPVEGLSRLVEHLVRADARG